MAPGPQQKHIDFHFTLPKFCSETRMLIAFVASPGKLVTIAAAAEPVKIKVSKSTQTKAFTKSVVDTIAYDRRPGKTRKASLKKLACPGSKETGGCDH